MFRAVGCLSQNQEADAGFPDRLGGVRPAALRVSRCDPAANNFRFQRGADRTGYCLTLA